MIQYVQGDILDADADAIVIPVNCLGAMGKGLAKQAAVRWPDLLVTYRGVCKRGELIPGSVVSYALSDGRTVLCAATKSDWRYPSKIEWVDDTLRWIHRWIHSREVPPIVALPMLGCGEGKLDWRDVHRCIAQRFLTCPRTVYIYGEEPKAKVRRG